MQQNCKIAKQQKTVAAKNYRLKRANNKIVVRSKLVESKYLKSNRSVCHQCLFLFFWPVTMQTLSADFLLVCYMYGALLSITDRHQHWSYVRKLVFFFWFCVSKDIQHVVLILWFWLKWFFYHVSGQKFHLQNSRNLSNGIFMIDGKGKQ